MNIRDIFNPRGYKFSDYNQPFGMEIETETLNKNFYPSGFLTPNGSEMKGHSELRKYAIPSTRWRAVDDHSLRNFGIEYVLIDPLGYSDTIKAIDEFAEMTKKIRFITDPPGASVHVHVNMLPETPLTLVNFVTLWVLFENLMVEYCGVPRRSNLFALPLRVAEDGLKHYTKLFKGLYEKENQIFHNFFEDSCKYSALNLATLLRLGTVEIRTMRGTVNPEVLKTWVSLLWKMLQFSRTPGLTPQYILEDIQHDPTELLIRTFGDTSSVLMNPYWKAHVNRNLHYVAQLVSSVEVWDAKEFGNYPVVEALKKREIKKKVGDYQWDSIPTFSEPTASIPIAQAYGGGGTLTTQQIMNALDGISSPTPIFTDVHVGVPSVVTNQQPPAAMPIYLDETYDEPETEW